MTDIIAKELKNRQIFTFHNIKCVLLGPTINNYYIITPIPSEIPSKEAEISTFFWKGPHSLPTIKRIIDEEPLMYKTGYYFGIPDTYIVSTDNEFLKVKEVPDDKNYLFPSIESL